MPYVQTLPPSYNSFDPAERPAFVDDRGMRIVHLSTFDIAGGAGRAAYRIHSGLRQAGIRSSMFVREARTKDRSVITFDPPQTLYRRVVRRIRRQQIQRNLHRSIKRGNRKFEPFRHDWSEYGTDIVTRMPGLRCRKLALGGRFSRLPLFF